MSTVGFCVVGVFVSFRGFEEKGCLLIVFMCDPGCRPDLDLLSRASWPSSESKARVEQEACNRD